MAQLADLHVAALLGLIRAHTSCYDAKVPDDPALPYNVLYTDNGQLSRSSLGVTSDRFELWFQVTSVGATRQQAGWAADKARADLLDQIPTVTGRHCGPITQDAPPQPVQRDDDLTPPVFYVTASYRLTSVPD